MIDNIRGGVDADIINVRDMFDSLTKFSHIRQSVTSDFTIPTFYFAVSRWSWINYNDTHRR